MADPGAMAVGLKNNALTVAGLNGYEYPADKPEPPCVLVYPDSPFQDPETMHRGVFSVRFVATLLVSDVFSDIAFATLYGYAKTSGTGSLFAALESDQTLGGAADQSFIEQINHVGVVEWNDLRYVGAQYTIRVIANG